MTTGLHPADEAESPSGRRRALGSNYHRLFSAHVISNLGDGMAQIAYPWLASALTRNPLLIALVAVMQRLPWLLFTLPAGVITDRADRRQLIYRMDLLRGALTLGVAGSILALGDGLPEPDALDTVAGTRTGLLLVVLVASLLLGGAEVLRDNSAQTILPAIVRPDQLEQANGRLWSAELVANTFIGPPLGSALLAIGFVLPFLFDAGTFFASAGLAFLLVGHFRARPAAASADEPPGRRSWTADLREGVRWLWQHPLLRTLAVTLGILNALGQLQFATLILFAQEVLDTTPVEFAVLTMGTAIGGVVGGVVAPRVTGRLGAGPALWLTLVATALTPIPIGLTSWWPVVFVMFGLMVLVGVIWNVITVSLRQTIIPDHLLGRVNSVYRFFGWGMMPIGTALGGLVVVAAETVVDRETALRAPWFVSAGLGGLLLLYAVPRLTTDKIEAARAAAPAPDRTSAGTDGVGA
jgi:MFS family permease